jgi:hypothetical protein
MTKVKLLVCPCEGGELELYDVGSQLQEATKLRSDPGSQVKVAHGGDVADVGIAEEQDMCGHVRQAGRLLSQ